MRNYGKRLPGLILIYKDRDLGACCKVLGFLGTALARLRAEPIPHHLCSSGSMQCCGVSLQLPGLFVTPLLSCASVLLVPVLGEGIKALPHHLNPTRCTCERVRP